ncbi:DUF397 domain-containing protein [Streptomyces sp. NPDC059477]|uniref:DUF397 domain-containing protein n=1 Tax=Streptomyces sp. NPDC059477 TaxID=3346847 RepID=UPI0036986C9D
MITPYTWRKSSYSGGGVGNGCVEVADGAAHIAIRDSKTPAGAILTIPTSAFTTFVEALKPPTNSYSTVTDFAKFRG